MKILITILILLSCTILSAVEIDYDLSVGKCKYAEFLYAKPYGDNYIIYTNLYDADSTLLANNAYFLDTDAPFEIKDMKEVDVLLDTWVEKIEPEQNKYFERFPQSGTATKHHKDRQKAIKIEVFK